MREKVALTRAEVGAIDHAVYSSSVPTSDLAAGQRSVIKVVPEVIAVTAVSFRG